METQEKEPVRRIWVNTEEQVVSFHREPGFEMLEFRSWEHFQSAIDQYTRQRYRYQ